MVPQVRFNLTKFNAVPAELHLVINAVKELNGFQRQPAHQITASVQPRSWLCGQRIGNELRGSEIGPVQIAASHPDAANIEFSRHAYGQRHHFFIKYIGLDICDWAADGYRGSCIITATPCRHVNCSLSGTIKVVEWNTR